MIKVSYLITHNDIIYLSKGSVVVEHTVSVQRSNPDLTEEAIRCGIWIRMGPNTTLPDGRPVVRTNEPKCK